MIIRQLTDNEDEYWDEYVLDHSEGSSYQLSAWKNAVKKAYGFKSCYLVAEKMQGSNKQIIGIFPLIFHKIPFVKMELVSLPFCDAGGLLADSEDVEKALIEKAFSLAEEKQVKGLLVRSSKQISGIHPDITLNTGKVRMVLNLPETTEELMASFKSKVRSQVKKPSRDGLTADIGGKEFLDDFYMLFSENMRDLGSPVHSRKWFEFILREYNDHVRLVIVRLENDIPSAGGIILLHPRQVSVPWASSLRKYNRFNPNMLLYWTFLKFSIEKKVPLFDFGRSTPGEGTYRFKKQWGADEAPLHWIGFDKKAIHNLDLSSNSLKNQISNGFKRGLAETLIQKLPIFAATAFGSKIRKYITL